MNTLPENSGIFVMTSWYVTDVFSSFRVKKYRVVLRHVLVGRCLPLYVLVLNRRIYFPKI